MVMFISKGTPLAALTGTADKNTLTVVSNKLVLKQPLVLRISPNRKNIRFSVKKNKKEHLLSELDWLTTCIKENGDSTPKTIIFCNTMNEIACVTNYLMLKLGVKAFSPPLPRLPCNCLVGIYHSTSWGHNKERIIEALKSNGKPRVIVSSSALSMGVNFPDVRYIINWGPARNLLDQHQEIGRAGRDGKNSYSLIVYHGQQLSQCEASIKRFVKTDGCLRVAAYKEFDENIEPLKPNHNCCSYCSYLCRCSGDKCSAEVPLFERDHSAQAPQRQCLSRPVSNQDKADLKAALIELQERMTNTKCCGQVFSSQLVEDVTQNCNHIFTVHDIVNTCPVFSVDHALKILEIIQEIFLDIPNFDESIEMLQAANLSVKSNEDWLPLEQLLAMELGSDICFDSDNELPEDENLTMNTFTE